eukprot:3995839-Pyramimonas_sp.AAC.1
MGSWASASARTSRTLSISIHIFICSAACRYGSRLVSPPGLGDNPPCARFVILVVEGVGENSHGTDRGGCLPAA